MRDEILKDGAESKQYIDSDATNTDGTIEPFISFNGLLDFYYYNVYHQRSIKLKASLLSQVLETDLERYLPKNEFAKQFLFAFIHDLELYGTSFLEKAGSANNYYLYNILGYQGRINKNKEIFQINSRNESQKLEGHYLRYYSPISKFYGEPDYLTALRQINTSHKSDVYNENFFDNGARPGYGIIFENSSPNPQQMTTFKEFFGANYKGYENSHKTFVAHTGKTAEGSPPAKIRLEKLDDVEDMSFEKLKSVNKNEIIAAHGVPPRLVGVMAAGQLGGGTELIDQLHAFNQTIIIPKIDIIEDFFSSIGIKHKIKELDVTSFKDDSSLVSNLVSSQIISPSEAKEILGFNSKVK